MKKEMNKIILRGKYSGRWYYFKLDEYFEKTNDDEPKFLEYCLDIDSIGQFVGYCDIHNSHIFTGDIVKSDFDTLGVVKFGVLFTGYPSYYIEWNDGDLTGFEDSAHCDIEIIGNIFDNGELIEES